jgi:hypothetical protein
MQTLPFVGDWIELLEGLGGGVSRTAKETADFFVGESVSAAVLVGY